MKKSALALIAILALGTYSHFAILKPEREKQRAEVKFLFEADTALAEKLSVTMGDQSVRLEKRQGFWWVTSPQEYLANQEYVEKGLLIMAEAKIKSRFDFKEDFFGLRPGKAFMNFQFENGLNQRFRVGEKSAPGDGLYVLNEDSDQVFVVHNVWGQFLYYPLQKFYHPYLPIPGHLVKSVQLRQGEQSIWHLEPQKNQQMSVSYRGNEALTKKAAWVWFFKKLREFSVNNLRFNAKRDFQVAQEMIVSSDKGNIIFQFNDEGTQLFVPSLNVYGDIDAYSLKSLDHELKKVFENDQK